MDLFKGKKKTLLIVSFCIFLIVQQIAIQYGRSYRARSRETDENGNDKLAMYEANELQKVWRKAAVKDLITPEKIADVAELQRARTRLEKAKREIENSEKRVQGIKGKRGEFFKKMHAYYNDSASALIAIIDFLLAKKREYSVHGNEINFESETDGEAFRKLINELSDLHRKKQSIDAFILEYNRELKKNLSLR